MDARCNNCNHTKPTFQATKICKDFDGKPHVYIAATLCTSCLTSLHKAGVKMRGDIVSGDPQ